MPNPKNGDRKRALATKKVTVEFEEWINKIRPDLLAIAGENPSTIEVSSHILTHLYSAHQMMRHLYAHAEIGGTKHDLG